MAQGKAHHERAYEVEDRLIRFNSVLLRATHWPPDASHGDSIRINCSASSWTCGMWKNYEHQVRGYHTEHFAAAMEDALHLNDAMRKLGDRFRDEMTSLQCVMTYLPVTQLSMQRAESLEDDCWADFCLRAASLDGLQEVLQQHLGTDAKAAVEALRQALWWSAARCDAVGATEDMVTCLRVQHMFGSCFLPQEAMRILPGNYLVVPVHVPVWNDEWEMVHSTAREHVTTVEKGEQTLLDLLPWLRSRMGLRELLWMERALEILAGTLEMFISSGAFDEFCAA